MSQLTLSENDRILVAGPLNFDTVPALRIEGNKLLQQLSDGRGVFDLEGVTEAGSAALSLLFCWVRQARTLDMGIEFENLPTGMLGVAAVSGVEQLLPLVSETS